VGSCKSQRKFVMARKGPLLIAITEMNAAAGLAGMKMAATGKNDASSLGRLHWKARDRQGPCWRCR
jgi:hypothetical protein